MPSDRRSGKVCESENVESCAENHRGETIECRSEPGNLGLVDGEMRGDWAQEALLREDIGGGCLVDVLGSCEPIV